MSWQPSPYSVVPALAALNTAVVFAFAWRYRSRSRSLVAPFLVMVGAVVGWSAAYAVQLGFDAAGSQALWQSVGNTFGHVVPTAWFVLALRYSGRGEYVTRRTLAVLSVEPLAMTALTWANRDLLWTVDGLSTGAGPRVLTYSFEPVYYPHLAYSYLLLLAGIVLVLDVVRRPSGVYRKQAGALVAGVLVPTSANVLFTLGASPVPNLDLTTSTFAVSGVVVGLALFRYDLLDLAPVARRGMLAELDAGIVVLDADDRVVEVNDAAARILDPPPTVGEHPDPSFPVGIDDLEGTVLEATVDGAPRFYDVHVSPITDHREDRIGRFVGLVDVTGLRAREQRLTVANRLLRHNLRNSVSVIDGYAQRLEGAVGEGPRDPGRGGTGPSADAGGATLEGGPTGDRPAAESDARSGGRDPRRGNGSSDDPEGRGGLADGEAVESVRLIRQEASRLAALGEKAREMIRTLDRDVDDGRPVDVVPAVERAVEDVDREHPSATVETDLPESVYLRGTDRRSVEVAVGNLIENAIRHNDAAEPWVRVHVSTAGPDDPPPADAPGVEDPAVAVPNGGPDARTVRIRVEDDGPGIPADEREVLARGDETPLEHGSGLGLWIVRWVVRTAGGEVAIADRRPRGTAVTLTFPRGDPPEGETGPGTDARDGPGSDA